MSNAAFQPDDELLSAYIDGELSAAELRAVQEWLDREPAAQASLDELRSVSAMVQSLPPATLPASWSAKLAERLDEATAAQSARSTSTGASPAVSIPSGDGRPAISFGRSSRGWWYSGAAIAAAVAIVAATQFINVQAPRDVAMKAPAAGAEVATPGGARPARASNAVPEMRAMPSASDRDSTMLAADDENSSDEATEPLADRVATVPAPATARTPAPVAESLAEPSADLAAAPAPPLAAVTDGNAATATIADANTYLIVWADVPPEALRGQQINRVLASNGIQVEQRTVGWSTAAEPVRQQIELRNNLAANASNSGASAAGGGGFGGGAGSSRFSVPDPSRARAADRAAAVERDAIAEEALAEYNPLEEDRAAIEGETILVEATADQIAACLADMEQDSANYASITVEPVQPELVAQQLAGFMQSQLARRSGEFSAEGQAAAAGAASSAQGESFGTVPQRDGQSLGGRGGEAMQKSQAATLPRARRLERPEQWYMQNSAPQDAKLAYRVRGSGSKASKANAKQSVQATGKREQLSNINRFLSAQNVQAPGQQQMLTEQQPVQVLFVLRNTVPASLATASDATEAPASEATEASEAAPAEAP